MRAPPCPYASKCGGCSLQDLEYLEQIAQKKQSLSVLFGQAVEVVPAPSEFGYRSRMDFIISQGKIGLREQGKARSIVDVKNCLLLSQKAQKVFEESRSLLLQSQLSTYSYESHKGFLRYLSIRESREGLLVILTTNKPVNEEEEECKSIISSLSTPNIVWNIHEGKTDNVEGAPYFVKGLGEIPITLLTTTFSVGPHTFFQSNIDVAENMFSQIKDYVEGETLDLFCGVGAISLCVASKSSSLLGVEEFAPSIESAKQNASFNKITNARFIADSSLGQLKMALQDNKKYDTIIVDPPRTGLGFETARAMTQLEPKTIIYMSCNPRTLRQDMESLKPYKPVFLKAYDMFPQTSHVECLFVFRKET